MKLNRIGKIISGAEKRNSSVGEFPDINLAGRQIVICVPQVFPPDAIALPDKKEVRSTAYACGIPLGTTERNAK